MSKFWSSTPTLSGADAESLRESLKKGCSPEEMDRRIEIAKQRLAKAMRRYETSRRPKRNIVVRAALVLGFVIGRMIRNLLP